MSSVRFNVVTLMVLQVEVLWEVTLCHRVSSSCCFEV